MQFKGCNFWANGGFSSSSGYHVYSVEWWVFSTVMSCIHVVYYYLSVGAFSGLLVTYLYYSMCSVVVCIWALCSVLYALLTHVYWQPCCNVSSVYLCAPARTAAIVLHYKATAAALMLFFLFYYCYHCLCAYIRAPWGDMKFYVDGNLACSANMWWSGGGAFPTPFNQPFYAILNLAVGGNWPVSTHCKTTTIISRSIL
jgi:hypothetical protein